jgi:hypothetical protein
MGAQPMQTMFFLFFLISLVGVYHLVKIAMLLTEMNGHMRDIAFHARRIPVDPSD